MDYLPQSVRWLMPEEQSPCDIFLHFRGQYALTIAAGEPLALPALAKLAKAGYAHVYIKKADLPSWQAYTARRHPAPTPEKDSAAEKGVEAKNLYGNKRAELLSYLPKVIVPKAQGVAGLDAAFRKAAEALQRVAKNPLLDWYFQQFHEPPTLLQHNGRVAFSCAVFCFFHNLASEAEIDAVIYSALIHELEGDPAASARSVVSQATLTHLERHKRAVPANVIELIRLHDELCSGTGFPNNRTQAEIPLLVRAFTLCNHFEHYRIQANGTRRARFDRVKQQMAARGQDYDAGLLPKFWEFWEKHVEVTA